MKKMLFIMFLFVFTLFLTSCENTDIEFKVSYDNEGTFGFKEDNNILNLFGEAYITSKEQLISLCNEWDNKSFDENEEYYNSNLAILLRTYDDEYFDDNNIIIIEFETGRGIDSRIKNISIQEEKIVMTVKQKEKKGIWTTEAFHWLMIVEVSKESTNDAYELVVVLGKKI